MYYYPYLELKVDPIKPSPIGYHSWLEALDFLDGEGKRCSFIKTFVSVGNRLVETEYSIDTSDIWDRSESQRLLKDFILFDTTGLVDFYLITY